MEGLKAAREPPFLSVSIFFFFFYSCAKEYDHHQEIVFIRQIQRVSCKEEGILVLVPRELHQDPAELSLCSGGKTNDQK